MSSNHSNALGRAMLGGAMALLVGATGCSEPEASGSATATETPQPQAQEPSSTPAPNRVNDTGITFSGNHPRTVNDDCRPGKIDPDDEWLKGEQFEAAHFAGQDCEYGRDALAADNSDGFAGFSFVKIAADGTRLPADAAEWDCVLDEVTGLMWEVKKPSDGVQGNTGLHDGDDRYSWYNTDTRANAGNPGDWNRDGDTCLGYQNANPAAFCNTQAYVARINNAGLCSYSNWRLPDHMEMTGIVHYGRTEPAIDVDWFPNTVVDAYWVANPAAGFDRHARTVHFKFGMSGIGMRMDRNAVRVVRSHADPAVRDSKQ